MKMNMEKDLYLTKDLFESAFLYASHKTLSGLKKDNHFYWFIFEDRQGCIKLIDSFWRKEATVNAKEYADALRSLKDRLFALKGGSGA